MSLAPKLLQILLTFIGMVRCLECFWYQEKRCFCGAPTEISWPSHTCCLIQQLDLPFKRGHAACLQGQFGCLFSHSPHRQPLPVVTKSLQIRVLWSTSRITKAKVAPQAGHRTQRGTIGRSQGYHWSLNTLVAARPEQSANVFFKNE